MRKRLLLLFTAVLAVSSLTAQKKIDVAGVLYDAEYMTPRTQVTNGVWKYSYSVPGAGLEIYVVESDLMQNGLGFKVCLAHDSLYYAESLTSMYNRKNTSENRVVAMMNGDFFRMGTGLHTEGDPCNGVMIDGIIGRTPVTKFGPMLGFDENNVPYFGNMTYSGVAKVSYFNYPITKINTDRSSNDLVLFNSLFGTTTKTNNYGSEAILKLADGQKWALNQALKCKVKSISSKSGNNSIAKDEIILSGHGTSEAIFDRLSVGTEISITLSLKIDETNEKPSFMQMFGSNTLVLKDGIPVSITTTAGAPTSNADRMAVGHSADKSKFYMVSIEGGTKTADLSGILKSLGATDAMNCDGGGSSGLFVDGKKFNTIYGGRRVANSLMLVESSLSSTQLSKVRSELQIISHADGSFQVVLPENVYTQNISVYDMITGRPVIVEENRGRDVYSVPFRGSYLIKVTGTDGEIYVAKWLK